MVALGVLAASAGCGLMLSYSDYETVAGTAGTGGTGATGGGGTGGAGATGGHGPEDCINGVDDDGDELIDCADADDCPGSTYSCVEVPPGWTGPLVGFPGNETPPPCSAPYVGADISTMQYPMIGWSDCGCRCVPTAPECQTREVLVNVHPYTSDTNCTTSCTSLPAENELSVPPGAGDCVALGTDLFGESGGNCVNTPSLIKHWKVSAPAAPPAQGGCTPLAVPLASNQPPITSASWKTLEGMACELPSEPSAAGCDDAHRCMPAPPTGASYCIVQEWQGGTPPIDCPAPYDAAGVLLFNGPTDVTGDSRGCQSADGPDACQCTPATEPLNGYCVGGKVNVRTGAALCANSTISATLDVGQTGEACTPAVIRLEYDDTDVSFDPSVADPCAFDGQAVPAGGVSFDESPVLMVCCMAGTG